MLDVGRDSLTGDRKRRLHKSVGEHWTRGRKTFFIVIKDRGVIPKFAAAPFLLLSGHFDRKNQIKSNNLILPKVPTDPLIHDLKQFQT
jgi:hypothetical protein